MENLKKRYFIDNYWNYYQELENEFLQVRKYIEFSEKNFKTYSIELLKLYQAVCSEIDVIGKIIATELSVSHKVSDNSNIYKWWFEIQDFCLIREKSRNYLFNDYEIKLLDMISMKPWENFKAEKYLDKKGRTRFRCLETYKTPTWWSDYNKVKHHRISFIKDVIVNVNYTKANFKNTAYAFGALYILLLGYADFLNIRDELDKSKLFDSIKPITGDELEILFKVA